MSEGMECPPRATCVGQTTSYAADFQYRFGWDVWDFLSNVFLIALTLFCFIYQIVQGNLLLVVAGIGFAGCVLWSIYDHLTGRAI